MSTITAARSLLRPSAIAPRALQQPSALFSTSRRLRASNPKPESDQNPSYPAFSLKSIVPNPRARMVFWGVFAVLATMEGLAWFKFLPKVMGKEEASTTGEEDSKA
ncbi:hypothetical protein B0H67DRAFT_337253 [Lasiosphaeris hirsuta]|uniref:Uncharacterized protein n=1 Tax=Lasiosphaeris hirsuta TaxID=260670 RepID=A0AA40A358_9PEZI|nr:hypothetical protein B0H67DRAFT_337253 [Lasiosphaeris hirsuta]